MSIQTTSHITKDEAIRYAKIKYMEKNDDMLTTFFNNMGDSALEDYIEECFYNFIITNEPNRNY